jgi:hypothetical protein
VSKGGARPGAGRKPKPKVEPVGDKSAAAHLLVLLNGDAKAFESKEAAGWRELWNAQDLRVRLDTRKYLYDKRDGKAVHTVNHLHDKPIEVTHTFKLSDEIREARERAAKK